MVIINRGRTGKKESGGRYKSKQKKRKFEIGSRPTNTRIEAQRIKKIETKGGGVKSRVYFSDIANLLDPKTKTYSKAKIKTVVGNPANRHYVRRNIMTKGTIIETEKGRARITSRPGQDGTVNAVLI